MDPIKRTNVVALGAPVASATNPRKICDNLAVAKVSILAVAKVSILAVAVAIS